MNASLRNALNALKRAGALGVPSAIVVDVAPYGAQWNGTKDNGDRWSLTKNNTSSFNCMF